MARTIVTNYSVGEDERTITLTGLQTVQKDKIVSITETRTRKVLYLSSDASRATLQGKTLTLPVGVKVGSTTLTIVYDDEFVAVPGQGIVDVQGLQSALDGKASSSHTHVLANTTGLQTALDTKATFTAVPWVEGPVDFNTLTTPGVYFVGGSFLNGDATTYNQPGNTGNIKLTVTTCASPSIIQQEYISVDGANKGGQRRRWEGTWNGWMAY